MTDEPSSHAGQPNSSGANPSSGESTTRRADHEKIVDADASGKTIISSAPPISLPRVPSGMHPNEIGKQLEGERLGHFELRQFIGGGGMGAVFKAQDTMLDRTVAVKVLATDQANDVETQRRFRNEAQSAARLDHVNIARVYYVGEDRGVQYIVFEYIEGINIRDLVDRNGPLPIPDVLSVALQLTEALTHASQREVVHRDIKPSNVLITPTGRAKLVDMGLARLHQVENATNDLTASGVTLGTFDYISPEQARDPRTADVRSDLYSLGCTIYFMLTGRPPFPEGTVLQKLLQHQADEPPDPSELRPDLPDDLTKVVRKLLAKSPEERFQLPSDLTADLVSLAEVYGLPITRPGSTARYQHPDGFLAELSPEAVRPWRRHLPWVTATLLLVGTALVLDRPWAPMAEPVSFTPLRTSPSQVVPPPMDPTVEQPISAQRPTDTTPTDSVETEPSEGAGDQAVVQTPAQEPGASPIENLLSTNQTAARSSDSWSRLPWADWLGGRLGLAQDPLAQGTTVAPATEGQMSVAVASTSSGLDLADVTPMPGRPVAPPTQQGVLVVTTEAGQDGYSSLGAACAAVESGEIIELRYHGPRAELPLQLASKKITIRAGEGFRPQVVFHPAPADLDARLQPRSMITITSGELSWINIDLGFDVPRGIASEEWSLFELQGAQTVRVVGSTLTVRGATEAQATDQQGVSFFRVVSSPEVQAATSDEISEQPQTIDLENVVARGEATFLSTGDANAVELSWRNGLLATSKHLLKVHSREDVNSRLRHRLLGELRHLTLAMEAGLAVVRTSGSLATVPEVELHCRDSILIVGPTAALVEHTGAGNVQKLQAAFTWEGNRNFYEGVETFWRLPAVLPEQANQRMNRQQWEDYWRQHPQGDEIMPGQGRALFSKPVSQVRPYHLHQVDDYLLDTQVPINPPRGAASDGEDVGLNIQRLPQFLMAPVTSSRTDF